MPAPFEFLGSAHFLGFSVALLIFFITIFLVAKRWISFSIALLLLLFSLVAGFLVDQQQMVQNYFQQAPASSSFSPAAKDDFQKQITQAVENLQLEVSNEKENLKLVMDQVQEVFHSVEAQKDKLQQFIEEMRERFKTNPPSFIPSESETPSLNEPVLHKN